jgi:membrane protein YqaA with SNARE-associated domain
MKSRIYKNTYKEWVAETVIMLTDKLQLTIRTSKHSRGVLITRATCATVSDDGSCTTYVMGQDYNETIDRHYVTRVTEKVIEECHFKTYFEKAIADAKAHYNL